MVRREAVKKTFAGAILAPLLPFKKPMIKAIKKKSGRDMSKSKFIDVVKVFAKEILGKKEEIKTNLESFDNVYDYQRYYGENFQDNFHLVNRTNFHLPDERKSVQKLRP